MSQPATPECTRVPITTDTEPPCVISDNGRHSAILIETGRKWASIIAMDSRGLRVKRLPLTELRTAYCAVPEYPLERAARIYLNHAEYAGGTERALEALRILSTLFHTETTAMSTTQPTTKKLHSSELRADSANAKERAAHAQLKAEEAGASKEEAAAAAKKAFDALFHKTKESSKMATAKPEPTTKPAAPKKAEKPAPKAKAEKPAPKAKAEKPAPKAKAEKPAASRSRINVDARIKILAKENPKRAGSRSAEIFDGYKNTKGEGRTVAEVLKRFPEHEDYVYASLRWDVKQGFIKLEG